MQKKDNKEKTSQVLGKPKEIIKPVEKENLVLVDLHLADQTNSSLTNMSSVERLLKGRSLGYKQYA